MEGSEFVCTQADITNLKERMQKLDIVESFTRERAITKWKYYKLTNLTVFASLLKDVPMGCKGTQTTFEKPQRELPYFWVKYEATLQ